MLGRLRGKINFIFSRDPALDRSKPAEAARAVAAYNEAAGDDAAQAEARKALPLKHGRTPAVWHLMSLTDRGYGEVSRVAMFELLAKLPRGVSALADEATYNMDKTATMCGLVGAESAEAPDGTPLRLLDEDANGQKVLTAATMQALFDRYGPKLINELGHRIVELTELDPS